LKIEAEGLEDLDEIKTVVASRKIDSTAAFSIWDRIFTTMNGQELEGLLNQGQIELTRANQYL